MAVAERQGRVATRIKRLLDSDRDFWAPERPRLERVRRSVPGEGRGIEAAFAPFDVFCLAVALDLLDVGFKQGEIVVVMRHLRPRLERWFRTCCGDPGSEAGETTWPHPYQTCP